MRKEPLKQNNLNVDEEGREIKCPNCDSIKYWLNGIISGKRHYRCKECRRTYALNPFGRDDLKLGNISCRWCNSKNFVRAGRSKAGKITCSCRDCDKQFTIGAERPDILIAPEEFDFSHDIWTNEHLGYEKGIHSHDKINFSYIQQPWLKYLFKKFILYLSSTRLAFATLRDKVSYINIFADFLIEIGFNQEIEGINRDLVIEYFAYLKTNKYRTYATVTSNGAVTPRRAPKQLRDKHRNSRT
ncbi:MAG: hypothetical protein V7K73_07940, partial [Nostoc sp.]